MAALVARRWTDGLIVLLALLAQIEAWFRNGIDDRAAVAAAALLWTVPLLLRRRFPLGAPVTVFAALGAVSFLPIEAVTDSGVNPFALIAAFWIVGAHAKPRRALAGGGAGLAAMAVIVLNEIPRSGDAVPIFLTCAIAWATGRWIAERARRTEELVERAERLERDQAAAVLAERARLAREMHDVVAHSVSVMTVQAGAARMLLDEDPERARAPLQAVEETGHQAIAEMRRLLGVLEAGDDESARAPQPGLAQLGTLVEQLRSAGLPVEVSSDGDPRPLAPGVDLTAFRVVQEALTNVLRHAGAARARVAIRYLPDALELEVTNHGRVADGASDGNGLSGMRQRVALYGGELEAGPRAGRDGFEVRARLPFEAAAP